MSTRLTISIAIVLLAAFIVMGMAVWNVMPDQMASHWNASDQVNGYISRFWGVFLVPVMAAGMLVLFFILPQIDPLKANIVKFREAFNLFILLIMLFFGYIWVLTLVWNLGYTNFRMSTAMLPAMGLLFIYIGWMLRKAKRNFFIGIRTPWTLSSDKVWDKTHQLGSILFMISGVLALIGSLFGSNAIWFVMVPLLGSTMFLVVYSYVLYQRETKP
ncbi:MAG: SdpI family protein [Chloroflexi bacterium]|nr:SdpI family protein [Chloroflexota bacterium]